MPHTILVTGQSGLLGSHFAARLAARGAEALAIGRGATEDDWARAISASDSIVHLAGVTRAANPEDFDTGNRGTTIALADAVLASGKVLPILYASSIRATEDTVYGRSKRAAEEVLIGLNARTECPVCIYRLPSFFGTWSRPDYNSAIASFCNQAAAGRPIQVNTPDAPLTLVALDDVVDALAGATLDQRPIDVSFPTVTPVYATTVGEAARLILAIARGETSDADPGLVVQLTRTLQAHRRAIRHAN